MVRCENAQASYPRLSRSGSACIGGGKKGEFRDFTIATYEHRPFPSCFVLQCQNKSLYRTIHMKSSDYQCKKVNPPYRYSNKGNPSQVIFRHCTGTCADITRLLRGCLRGGQFMFRLVSKQSKTSNAVSSLIC